MSFKRGLQTPTAPAAPAPVAKVVGRTAQSIRQTTIVAPNQPAPPQNVITRPQLKPEAAVRGLLVDGTGKPLRGLSQQTLDAHKAHTENATELCTNCGKMVPPAHMKTVVANAYNSNNPLRLCDTPNDPTSCVKLAYKDPHKVEARQMAPWKPSIPQVRFDRETAAPYNAHERGVTLRELTTRDTYHKEREVPSQYRTDVLIGEGTWSGGGKAGHVVTRESVAASRDRAARVRR